MKKAPGSPQNRPTQAPLLSPHLWRIFWDTLGWILFKEGKLDAAQACRSLPPGVYPCAEKSARISARYYEAEGKKNKAATAFALAQDALGQNSRA